jgi:beta-galactosidase
VATDGRSNETTAAVGKVLSIVNAHSDLLSRAIVPPAKVVMVYDFASDLVSRIEDTRHNADYRFVRDLPGGYIYKAALQGAYHLFYLAGIQVDLLSSAELHRIREYPLAYLPPMFIVTDEQAKVLKDYVAGGGLLAAEGGTAQRQANTWLQLVRPGAGLDEVLGLREVQRVVWDDSRRGVILPDGRQAVSRLMNATFQLRTARPVARYDDGSPAVTTNDSGKGRALMTGFSPGLARLLGADQAWVEFVRWLVGDWGGLPGEVPRAQQAGLYVRRLLAPATEGGEATILFLFNRTGQGRTFAAPAAGVELATGKRCQEGQVMDIEPGGVKILAFPASAAAEGT